MRPVCACTCKCATLDTFRPHPRRWCGCCPADCHTCQHGTEPSM